MTAAGSTLEAHLGEQTCIDLCVSGGTGAMGFALDAAAAAPFPFPHDAPNAPPSGALGAATTSGGEARAQYCFTPAAGEECAYTVCAKGTDAGGAGTAANCYKFEVMNSVLKFTGGEGAADAELSKHIVPTGGLSMGAWVYPECDASSAARNATVMYFGSDRAESTASMIGGLDQGLPVRNAIKWHEDAADKGKFFYYDSLVGDVAHTAADYHCGKWHYVAVTIGEQSDGVLYVNGAGAVAEKAATRDAVPSSATAFTTHSRPDNNMDGDGRGTFKVGHLAGEAFAGSIDEITVYNAALDAATVVLNMRSRAPVAGAALKAHYTMRDATPGAAVAFPLKDFSATTAGLAASVGTPAVVNAAIPTVVPCVLGLQHEVGSVYGGFSSKVYAWSASDSVGLQCAFGAELVDAVFTGGSEVSCPVPASLTASEVAVRLTNDGAALSDAGKAGKAVAFQYMETALFLNGLGGGASADSACMSLTTRAVTFGGWFCHKCGPPVIIPSPPPPSPPVAASGTCPMGMRSVLANVGGSQQPVCIVEFSPRNGPSGCPYGYTATDTSGDGNNDACEPVFGSPAFAPSNCPTDLLGDPIGYTEIDSDGNTVPDKCQFNPWTSRRSLAAAGAAEDGARRRLLQTGTDMSLLHFTDKLGLAWDDSSKTFVLNDGTAKYATSLAFPEHEWVHALVAIDAFGSAKIFVNGEQQMLKGALGQEAASFATAAYPNQCPTRRSLAQAEYMGSFVVPGVDTNSLTDQSVKDGFVAPDAALDPASGTCCAFTMGKQQTGGILFDAYEGFIDEVAVWNRALDAAEIAAVPFDMPQARPPRAFHAPEGNQIDLSAGRVLWARFNHPYTDHGSVRDLAGFTSGADGNVIQDQFDDTVTIESFGANAKYVFTGAPYAAPGLKAVSALPFPLHAASGSAAVTGTGFAKSGFFRCGGHLSGAGAALTATATLVSTSTASASTDDIRNGAIPIFASKATISGVTNYADEFIFGDWGSTTCPMPTSLEIAGTAPPSDEFVFFATNDRTFSDKAEALQTDSYMAVSYMDYGLDVQNSGTISIASAPAGTVGFWLYVSGAAATDADILTFTNAVSIALLSNGYLGAKVGGSVVTTSKDVLTVNEWHLVVLGSGALTVDEKPVDPPATAIPSGSLLTIEGGAPAVLDELKVFGAAADVVGSMLRGGDDMAAEVLFQFSKSLTAQSGPAVATGTTVAYKAISAPWYPFDLKVLNSKTVGRSASTVATGAEFTVLANGASDNPAVSFSGFNLAASPMVRCFFFGPATNVSTPITVTGTNAGSCPVPDLPVAVGEFAVGTAEVSSDRVTAFSTERAFDGSGGADAFATFPGGVDMSAGLALGLWVKPAAGTDVLTVAGFLGAGGEKLAAIAYDGPNQEFLYYDDGILDAGGFASGNTLANPVAKVSAPGMWHYVRAEISAAGAGTLAVDGTTVVAFTTATAIGPNAKLAVNPAKGSLGEVDELRVETLDGTVVAAYSFSSPEGTAYAGAGAPAMSGGAPALTASSLPASSELGGSVVYDVAEVVSVAGLAGGAAIAGETVTVTGNNFALHENLAVTVGGQAVVPTSVAPEEMVLEIPSGLECGAEALVAVTNTKASQAPPTAWYPADSMAYGATVRNLGAGLASHYPIEGYASKIAAGVVELVDLVGAQSGTAPAMFLTPDMDGHGSGAVKTFGAVLPGAVKTGTFTVCLWIYLDEETDDAAKTARAIGAGTEHLYFSWKLFSVVADGAGSAYYVNGALATEAELPVVAGVLDDLTADGAIATAAEIDDVWVYDRALQPCEIALRFQTRRYALSVAATDTVTATLPSLPFTGVSAWVKVSEFGVEQTLVASEDGAFMVGISASGYLTLSVKQSPCNFDCHLQETSPYAQVPAGVWTHVAVTLDVASASKAPMFYVDGTLMDAGATSFPAAPTLQKVVIGKELGPEPKVFQGEIFSLRFFGAPSHTQSAIPSTTFEPFAVKQAAQCEKRGDEALLGSGEVFFSFSSGPGKVQAFSTHDVQVTGISAANFAAVDYRAPAHFFKVDGPGREAAIASKGGFITVTGKSACGVQVPAGGDSITVPGIAPGAATVTDMEDGTYVVKYAAQCTAPPAVPPVVSEVQVSGVKVGDVAATVTGGPTASRVFGAPSSALCGAVPHSFTITTTDATGCAADGTDVYTATVQGPMDAVATVAYQGEGIYTVTYVPEVTGSYRVVVYDGAGAEVHSFCQDVCAGKSLAASGGYVKFADSGATLDVVNAPLTLQAAVKKGAAAAPSSAEAFVIFKGPESGTTRGRGDSPANPGVSKGYSLGFSGDYTTLIATVYVGLGELREVAAPLPANVTLDDWTHVAATYDGTTFSLFADGDLIGTETFATKRLRSLDFNDAPLLVGPGFTGEIDEVKVLSEAQAVENILGTSECPLFRAYAGPSMTAAFDPASVVAYVSFNGAHVLFGAGGVQITGEEVGTFAPSAFSDSFSGAGFSRGVSAPDYVRSGGLGNMVVKSSVVAGESTLVAEVTAVDECGYAFRGGLNDFTLLDYSFAAEDYVPPILVGALKAAPSCHPEFGGGAASAAFVRGDVYTFTGDFSEVRPAGTQVGLDTKLVGRTAVQHTIMVTPAAPAAVEVTSVPSSAVVAGSTFAVTAKVLDAYGNTVTADQGLGAYLTLVGEPFTFQVGGDMAFAAGTYSYSFSMSYAPPTGTYLLTLPSALKLDDVGAPKTVDVAPAGWASPVAGDVPARRVEHTSVVYNGDIYMFGGASDAEYQNDLQVLVGGGSFFTGSSDPQWTTVATTNAPTPRYGHSASVVGDKMYVFGGERSGTVFKDLFAYDFATATWEYVQASNSPSPRYDHAAAVSGSTLIVSGGRSNDKILSDAWALDLNTMTWSALVEMDVGARFGHSIAVDGAKQFVFGGFTATGFSDDFFRCTDFLCQDVTNGCPESTPGTYTDVKGVGLTPRFSQQSFMKDGHLLVVGGCSYSRDERLETEGLGPGIFRYSVEECTWESIRDDGLAGKSPKLCQHTAGGIDGGVYVQGGATIGNGTSTYFLPL